MSTQSLTGIAYGFMYCEASKDEFEKELPALRRAAQTPSNLELSLMEVDNILKDDKGLQPMVDLAHESNFNYAIKAVCPKTSNENTAAELSQILMQANQSILNRAGELSGETIFKKDGKYLILNQL